MCSKRRFACMNSGGSKRRRTRPRAPLISPPPSPPFPFPISAVPFPLSHFSISPFSFLHFPFPPLSIPLSTRPFPFPFLSVPLSNSQLSSPVSPFPPSSLFSCFPFPSPLCCLISSLFFPFLSSLASLSVLLTPLLYSSLPSLPSNLFRRFSFCSFFRYLFTFNFSPSFLSSSLSFPLLSFLLPLPSSLPPPFHPFPRCPFFPLLPPPLLHFVPSLFLPFPPVTSFFLSPSTSSFPSPPSPLSLLLHLCLALPSSLYPISPRASLVCPPHSAHPANQGAYTSLRRHS